MSFSILIIDDDVTLLGQLGTLFEGLGWDVHRELSGESGLATFARTLPDVVLVEQRLPGIDGLEVLGQLRGKSTSVVVMSSDGHMPTAIRTIREGAENFLLKPIDPEYLQVVAERAAEKVRLHRVNHALIGRGATSGGLEALGSSAPMLELRDQVMTIARSGQSALLVRGETGSGKRTVARLIHDLSSRSTAPFIECVPATSDAQKLEATLFGVADGNGAAGALGSRPGLLETADGGTLLLHHIELAPMAVQQQLEQALERQAFRRCSSAREIPVDLRLIATTSIDPAEAVGAGRLSPELYYRLKAMEIVVPPLRDLPLEDMSATVHRMLRSIVPGLVEAPRAVSDAALERMVDHQWAGNFRELRHVLERAALQARGQASIGVEHLPGEFRARPGPFDRRHTPLTMEEVERMHIERTLRHHDGNRTRSAEELGISRATLIAKIKKYAIPL
jgi:DNA-binding NtrC family response regulator